MNGSLNAVIVYFDDDDDGGCSTKFPGQGKLVVICHFLPSVEDNILRSIVYCEL